LCSLSLCPCLPCIYRWKTGGERQGLPLCSCPKNR
jgi:hypothetical protein